MPSSPDQLFGGPLVLTRPANISDPPEDPRGGVAKANPKVDFQGIPIELDRPKGFVQEGTNDAGKPWRRLYLYDYGFIPGTAGGDGEDLDVFLGPNPEAETAYWATQAKGDGTFDEYKVFLGFPSAEHASLAYALHIPVHLCTGMTAVPVGHMKALLGLNPLELRKRMHFLGASGNVDGMSTPKTVDHRVQKADGISFDDLRNMVERAVEAVLPPPATDPGCATPCGIWISDLYEDAAVFGRDGATWQVGYSYGNGVVTLTGAPVQVVRQYVPVSPEGSAVTAAAAAKTAEDPMSASVTKDEKEAADAPGTPPPGGGGADIVALASDRMAQVVDGINAAGGVLTPELRASVSSIVTLLEAVAPDADEPMPTDVAAEDMTDAEKADFVEQAKRVTKWREYFKACVSLAGKIPGEANLVKRAQLALQLTKAVTYGQEVFGSGTGFSGGDIVTIPEFKDPAQLLPQDVATPSPQTATGVAAYNPGYTGVAPSQRDVADGGNAVAKRLEALKKSVAGLTGKGDPSPGAGTPVTKSAHGWSDDYLRGLPDTSFLHVEGGTKKAADGSDVGEGAGASKRHFPVYDCDGALHLPALKQASQDLIAFGCAPELKAQLQETMAKLLEQGEAQAVSKAQAALRGDNNWPNDMATPAFMAGRVVPPSPLFGTDNLPGKLAKDASKMGAKPAKRDHHPFDLNRKSPVSPK